jgi:uncharacterized membrane protein YbhN (UPF0104 family)
VNKLLRLAVSAALLTLVASRTEWDKVSAAIVHMRWQYWLAGVGLLMLAQVAGAWRWKYYADELRFERPLHQLTGFCFIGMYFNLTLPTSVGGDVVRAWYLNGQSERRLAAFASVFLERLNGLMVLVALACLGVFLSPQKLPGWISLSVWTIGACGVLGLLSLPAVARLGRLRPTRVEQLTTVLRLLRVPRILGWTLLLSLFVQAANVIVVWLIGQALHTSIPDAFYWILVPMVSLLTLLPISVNGMGVREGATALFLAPMGVAEGTAFTLAILWFAVYAVVSLLGGAVYLFGRFPKPETPAQGPGDAPAHEVTCGSLGGDSDQGRTGQHQQAA